MSIITAIALCNYTLQSLGYLLKVNKELQIKIQNDELGKVRYLLISELIEAITEIIKRIE
ncbi:hypothetical protein DMB65_04640 [Flavobacterium cheongpyeongense]|uniref:Uncharacterized protein n=1 Tax=Flavobacterium cheongpyeongense TaxID=2212651 RepID=A0A2V4BRZ1_9FLAO|nr:hypothetical protein DMB65_04640 [Flavobacterium cheongpyeongense]